LELGALQHGADHVDNGVAEHFVIVFELVGATEATRLARGESTPERLTVGAHYRQVHGDLRSVAIGLPNEELFYLAENSEAFIQSRMAKAEVLQAILYEVETLPPVRRQIFKMIYLDDLSTNEIAQQLNITADTVRVQKARALNSLRTQVLKKGLMSLTLLLAVAVFIYYW